MVGELVMQPVINYDTVCVTQSKSTPRPISKNELVTLVGRKVEKVESDAVYRCLYT